MCDKSNLLPCVTAVLEELNQIYKEKNEHVTKDIKAFRSLLKPASKESKIDSQSSPKPKPLSLRNSPFRTYQSKNSTRNSPQHKNSLCLSKYSDENFHPQATPCILDLMLQKGMSKELKECIDTVNEYIQQRRNSDKRSELEKQQFLLKIENSWEREFKTMEVFEPDLAESLFKYLSVLDKKKPDPEVPDWPIKKMMDKELLTQEADSFFEEAQAKIIAALHEDLSKIEYDNLKSEENKSLVIKLQKSVTVLRDIRHPKTSVVFKREPWQNLNAS